jgi:F0F1-type ATP synthase membrane subunit b/b'
MIAVILFLALIVAIVATAVIGGAKRQRQADTIRDLQQAEQIHHDAAASRVPIPDADTVLRSNGRLRD